MVNLPEIENLEELAQEIADLRGTLADDQLEYETACLNRGMGLPYPKTTL